MVLAIVFCIAVVLAGSDGAWFPYPNLIGLGMLCYVVWRVNRPTGA